MVDVPVTSSENSHVRSNPTKTRQKSGKKLFSGVWLLGLWCAKNFRELLPGVYNQGQPL